MNFVSVGNGAIGLRGRPGKAFFKTLQDLNCNRIVTLLSEREGGQDIGKKLKAYDVEWTWLPLENGQYPTDEAHVMLKAGLQQLSYYLDAGESIVIHCSAGIHRTGMVTYALLLYRGYSKEEALQAIAEMRDHTRNGMHDKHFEWGETVILELNS